jgi:hypothetical protein
MVALFAAAILGQPIRAWEAGRQRFNKELQRQGQAALASHFILLADRMRHRAVARRARPLAQPGFTPTPSDASLLPESAKRNALRMGSVGEWRRAAEALTPSPPALIDASTIAVMEELHMVCMNPIPDEVTSFSPPEAAQTTEGAVLRVIQKSASRVSPGPSGLTRAT